MPPKDSNTEEKIKLAASKLFTQKGYANTKTREIAEEAGINLALLNYYFRSKEKLFEMIMFEKLGMFISNLHHVLNDELAFEEQIEMVVSGYIDLLSEQPDLPIFVLSELRNFPNSNIINSGMAKRMADTQFFKELMQRNTEVNPIHFFMNIVGLSVFPFVVKPMVQAISGIENGQYNALMQERKVLVTQWIKQMINSR
ncbi:MAG: TetR/AcrR family transcriptional regulator [Bacteroidia bacterium]